MGVRNWKCPGNNLDSEIFSVQQKYSLPRPVAMFLVARGIPENEVEGFLEPRLANLSDPYRFPGIREAAARHGLPSERVRALIFRESRFDPAARGRAGEIGLMQVLPSGAAAEWARVRKGPAPSARELYAVRTNLEVGCFYLSTGMRRWRGYKGQTALALCQYNAGESRALKWRPEDPEDAEILSRITIRSTREYVRSVLKRYRRYCKKQEK